MVVVQQACRYCGPTSRILTDLSDYNISPYLNNILPFAMLSHFAMKGLKILNRHRFDFDLFCFDKSLHHSERFAIKSGPNVAGVVIYIFDWQVTSASMHLYRHNLWTVQTSVNIGIRHQQIDGRESPWSRVMANEDMACSWVLLIQLLWETQTENVRKYFTILFSKYNLLWIPIPVP